MALKLTLSQVKELLTSAGAPPVEIVDTDDLSDYATTAKNEKPVTQDSILMAIDANRETIIGPKIIHAKTGEIQSAVTGKLNGALRSQISQTYGIPLADIKDMDSKEALKAGKDFYDKTFGADKAELIKERDLLMTQHADNLKKQDEVWNAKLGEANEKLTKKEIIAQLVKDHNEAKGLPPTANKAALAKQFDTYLDSIAIKKYNEEKQEIELYDRKNPDLRLYTNDTKTTYAKPGDFMKPYYSDLGIWNEDNRSINPADEMKRRETGQYNPVVVKDGRPVNPIDAGNEAWGNYAKDAVAGK